MYWVVVYTAEPDSKWDLLPASFLGHHSALEYACDRAEEFIEAPDAPKTITILHPKEEPREWSIPSLIFTRSWRLA
jgi:hypothetical protein